MKNLEHRTAYQAWLLFNLGSYHIREKVGVCLVCLKLLSSIQSWTYLLTLFVMSTLMRWMHYSIINTRHQRPSAFSSKLWLAQTGVYVPTALGKYSKS